MAGFKKYSSGKKKSEIECNRNRDDEEGRREE